MGLSQRANTPEILTACWGAGFFCFTHSSVRIVGLFLEEDKRATTNVQNGLVLFFLFSYKKESLIFKKSPGGKALKKCGKVWKSAETILPFTCFPSVFLCLLPTNQCRSTDVSTNYPSVRRWLHINFENKMTCTPDVNVIKLNSKMKLPISFTSFSKLLETMQPGPKLHLQN